MLSAEALKSRDQPALSVLVIVASDTVTCGHGAGMLSKTLDALACQNAAPQMEVIVPYVRRPAMEGIESSYPEVRFVPVADLKSNCGPGTREHHDELRSRGIEVARGEIIAFTEDHATPDSHWCARLMDAHLRECAAVGGAIENAVDRPLNWAVYFCDFGQYHNPIERGYAKNASDVNVAYKRAALEAIRPVWGERFCELQVNSALLARGEKIYLEPEAVIYQARSGLTLSEAVRERFVWGWSYGALRAGSAGVIRKLLYVAATPVIPWVILMRMSIRAIRNKRTRLAFLGAIPITIPLVLIWCLGEATGYVRGRAIGAGQRISFGASNSALSAKSRM